MHRIDGAGHLGGLFVHEDPLISRPPTEVTADWLNSVQEELAAVVEWAGAVLDKEDSAQLLAALLARFAQIDLVASRVGVQRCAYSAEINDGTADALICSYLPSIEELTHGMLLRIRPAAANTVTVPTFTPHPGVIPAKPIVKGNNLPLAIGDIAGAGHWVELQYDVDLDKWVMTNPARGVVLPMASNAEAQALSDALKIISPATLAQAFKGGNQALAAAGYQKMPGGMVLQWGETASLVREAAAVTITFPVAFPNSCLCGFTTPRDTLSAGNWAGCGVGYFHPLSLTQASISYDGDYGSSVPNRTVFWLALGY